MKSQRKFILELLNHYEKTGHNNPDVIQAAHEFKNSELLDIVDGVQVDELWNVICKKCDS